AIEEIEIYLGYPIKLREALNLPITLQEMLYFRCSNLTAVDLETARADIIEKLANEEDFVTFLIEQDKWKETLKIKHPQEFESIQEAYANSEEDPDSAMAIYQTALKELTKALLQEPESKPVTSAKRSRVGARELTSIGINPSYKDTSEDEQDRYHKPVTRSSTQNP
ncbi:MAG: NEL-type E3 ubiquitin ligase domain-containing protein, partial [Chlamydiota bacterium]